MRHGQNGAQGFELGCSIRFDISATQRLFGPPSGNIK